jgi:BlaI family penicillinase repressor
MPAIQLGWAAKGRGSAPKKSPRTSAFTVVECISPFTAVDGARRLTMKSETKLGKVQLFIVQYLWSVGEARAREISDHVAAEHKLSHSTVQTLLRKLEKKGAVAHTERDRVFYYTARVRQDDVEQSNTRDFLDRVFQGSAAGLVSHMLENESFTPEELAEIRLLIDRYRQEVER